MVTPYLSSLHKDKDSLIASWQAVHGAIAGSPGRGATVADLLGYSVYYYTVYRTFGHGTDLALSRELLGQLLQLLAQTTRAVWTTTLLDQVTALAWLQAELARYPAATARPAGSELAQLDAALLAEAGALQAAATAESRPRFLRIMLYFYLRNRQQLPTGHWPQMLTMLTALINAPDSDFWFPFGEANTASPKPERTTALGLADGLAGELLLLIQLYEADGQLAGIRQQVRQGILYILSTKREVDFSEQKYAIFPAHVGGRQQEAAFDNELSWSHGDMGQSWLLYKSFELLQDAELPRLAELVGLNTLLRTDVRSTAVTSSRFDSGAAGVAHLYRKLFLASGHEAYRKGYAYWLTQTRSWLTHELPNGFYGHREGDLRQGLVGVGLVLLSAISEEELGWDRFLL
ncbi:hypothetical protein E5K00_12405 [Hymenobacter aquaticus]|uniref:Lanthionine synthetase n=1 Tax=Hymenobacter aquaticus TaxID=1867101 RepID=A0A4Z0Q8F2_9BACT|nr:lanthionine synthetase LanC family protein [Hymenobacter aquaticus]TGE25954.1 hypothetical protein E5K00_12405 [Hymenobacter aquaticus]